MFVYREMVESRRVQAARGSRDDGKRIPTTELVRRGGLNSGSSMSTGSSKRGPVQRHSSSSNGSQHSSTPPGSVNDNSNDNGRDSNSIPSLGSGMSSLRKKSLSAYTSPYIDPAKPFPSQRSPSTPAAGADSTLSFASVSDWLGSFKDYRPFQKGQRYTELST